MLKGTGSMSSGTESKNKSPTGWMSLEEYVREALQEGRDNEVVMLVKHLPEKKKERYRQIWREVKGIEWVDSEKQK